MFVATTEADCSKLRRSGMNEGFGTHSPCCWTDHEDMSLLGSWSIRVARVAINISLLTELLAAPAALLLREKCV